MSNNDQKVKEIIHEMWMSNRKPMPKGYMFHFAVQCMESSDDIGIEWEYQWFIDYMEMYCTNATDFTESDWADAQLAHVIGNLEDLV